MTKTKIVYASLLATLLLAACSSEQDTQKGQNKTESSAVNPITLSADRQDIYDTSCKVCHGMEGLGAPVSGKIDDWTERKEQGMETILDNVINGYQAMPAMGGCFACSEDDFREIITYMTAGQVK